MRLTFAISVLVALTAVSCHTAPLKPDPDSAPEATETLPPPPASVGTLPEISVSAKAFDGREEAFTEHPGYLSMSLPFAPTKAVYEELKKTHPSLITRKEAHITVITPPEFELLKAHISMDKIERIARDEGIQFASLHPLCVGKASASIDGRTESTFYILVSSDSLRRIRHIVAATARARGGTIAGFDPDHFYPHITVGFTKRDLFETDGVIKDTRSCAYEIEETEGND